MIITHIMLLLKMMLLSHMLVLLMTMMMLLRWAWGDESLLREDTDESLWFFGPAGENNYRVAGVSSLH